MAKFRCYHTCLFDTVIEAASEAEAKREYEALCGLAGVVVIAERVSETSQSAVSDGRARSELVKFDWVG